jgi:hypothetical protein
MAKSFPDQVAGDVAISPRFSFAPPRLWRCGMFAPEPNRDASFNRSLLTKSSAHQV